MQKTIKDTGIPVDELLVNTFQELKKITRSRVVSLPVAASINVANGTDHLSYEKAVLCGDWAVSVGKMWGNKKQHCKGDLVAVKVKKNGNGIGDEILQKLNLSVPFQNSLVIARNDGQMIISENSENPFGQKMLKYLKSVVADFVILPNDEVYAVTFESIPVLYKYGFAKVLADKTAEILNNE